MENLIKDARFALKLLWKERSFTAAALLTLALCIGANTAMFSVVNSVLLKPLPFADADELVIMQNSYPKAGIERGSNGVPDYYDRRELDAFEVVAMYEREGMTIGESGRPQHVVGLAVTPTLFDLLDIDAAVGRTFTAEEGEPGNERRALLSHGLWQEQYAGAADVVGRTIRVDDVVHTITGVMPRDFLFADPEVQLWIPLAFTAEQRSDIARHSNSWAMIARLNDGVTVERAQAEIDALNARLDERLPQFSELLRNVGFRTIVADYQSDMTREVSGTLWLLQAGVLVVLLIGCVNIANLVMVRSTARHRELATRSALGAAHSRLIRQLITEGVVLSILGGVLGLAVGWACVRGISTFAAAELPRGAEIGMDMRTVLVALGIALVAGLLFGAIPVIRLMRGQLISVFREEGRTGTASRTTRALRGGLVVAQVSLAFALLIGAGLLIASFVRLTRVDPGFETGNMITGSFSMPVTRYPDEAARRQFTSVLLDRVRALPGVESAAATNVLPFGGNLNSSVVTPEGYMPEPGEALSAPINSRVSDGYFEAMDIEVVAGRDFTPGDAADAPLVAVVDRTLAERFWPDRDPLGQRIAQGAPDIGDGEDLTYRTVVGVVDEVRVLGITDDQPPGHYYTPLAQQPASGLALAVRTQGDPVTLANSLRSIVTALDPDMPLNDVLTMEQRVSASLTTERARMILLSGFASLALLLSAIGLYGVLAYTVAQRSAEIGIRMALGSSARDVFRMVVGEGARLLAVGLALGFAGSLALSRVVRSMLYDVAPTDPLVYVAVLVLLSLTAIAASVIPARRAMRVDPLIAMRDS
ncbi:MAG TPA: ABC transporter permease [Longimicrobiales bacterium]|nr:ABC transporter permease [Longimicrobiales bacterium]